MTKSTGMILLLIFTFFIMGCQKDTSPITNTNMPDWLINYTEEMQNDPSYYRTIVYRYEWKQTFVYHIMIPSSSCLYCELYKHDGTKIDFNDNQLTQDFMTNKKNEKIVWEWKGDL